MSMIRIISIIIMIPPPAPSGAWQEGRSEEIRGRRSKRARCGDQPCIWSEFENSIRRIWPRPWELPTFEGHSEVEVGNGFGITERLAEYGWKPHRDVLAQKGLSRASIYWYIICMTNRGVRFHRIRDFKRYYFNSLLPTSQLHLLFAARSPGGDLVDLRTVEVHEVLHIRGFDYNFPNYNFRRNKLIV